MMESIDYFEYTSPPPYYGSLFGESLATNEPFTSSLSVSGISLYGGAPIIPNPGFGVQREAHNCPSRGPHIVPQRWYPGSLAEKENSY